MPQPYRVHLLGFSRFERSALGSYFRLANQRDPSFEEVADAADAHFLVADADHAGAVQAVRLANRVGDAVFIGAQAPDGAAAWMMRPIDPLHVLRELDAMVAVISPPLPNAQREQARQAARRPARAASPARRSGDGPLPTPPAAPPRTRPTGREALVVDDSEVAQRFLELKLQRWGLRTERAADSATAIELMTKRPFDFVFLDVELGQSSGLDGLALCHHIKRAQRLPEGRRLPVVTLVSAHATEIDRVRGALAGADAYLGKPLDDNALAEVMVSHGVFAPGTEGLR